jgi:sterol desaturase/sphingolipid hydroxylase (fatty acid hydroxylase superfamily)
MFLYAVIAGAGASSLVEYLLHRYYLHRSPKEPHIVKHHKNFNGETSYSQTNANKADIVSSNLYLAVNVALYSPFGYAFFQISQSFGIFFFASAIGYTLWIEYVHLLFHRPTGNRIEEIAFFKTIKEHHRIHHIRYRVNYGIGSDWWDRVFKTKRKAA